MVKSKPDSINKFLTSILFHYYSPMCELTLDMSLSTLIENFPDELIENHQTKDEAIIQFFNSYGLAISGSHSLDRVIIRNKDYSFLIFKSQIVP